MLYKQSIMVAFRTVDDKSGGVTAINELQAASREQHMAQRNSLVLEKSIGAILRALSSLLVRLRKVFNPNLRQGVPLTSFEKRQVDPCQRERPALDRAQVEN